MASGFRSGTKLHRGVPAELPSACFSRSNLIQRTVTIVTTRVCDANRPRCSEIRTISARLWSSTAKLSICKPGSAKGTKTSNSKLLFTKACVL